MKKLFMFLAVAGLATFGASCSSDDGGGGDTKTLTLSADKTSVKVNETVTFTASEKDAEIYVGDKKISNSTKFDKEGSYNVVAKKKGFNDSPVVKITVTKDGGIDPEVKQLTLTALPTSVKIGDVVTFIVKEGNNVVTDATITQVGGAAITGNTWTAATAGSFKFKATKTGAKDSAEVTVIVTDNGTPGTGNFYKVGNTTYDIVDNDLAVRVNASNQVILYNDKLPDGTPFWFIVYTLFSNTDDGENTFARVDFAAIVTTQPTTRFDPKDAEMLLPLSGLTALDGSLESEVDMDNDTTVDLTFTNWSATPASNGVPGQVAYKFTSAAFNLEFDGDYNGLYTVPAPAAPAQAKGVSIAKKSTQKVQGLSLVKSNVKFNLKF